jgi:hypothetical protein
MRLFLHYRDDRGNRPCAHPSWPVS